MFSGLVECKSLVTSVKPEPGGILLEIQRPFTFDDVQLGSSIAIDGCCLTVIEFDHQHLSFQAGEETLSRTILGKCQAGQEVNLERSLQLSDRLGGHLVTGHIDGIGQVTQRRDHDQWSDFRFSAPTQLMRQMVSKGSIAIDGVSLTLVDVSDSEFSVALIPHTLQVTTLGRLQPGNQVNLETDLIAKYVQRQMQS
ncbi:MAG: riboflavin synthase [Planctomycetales bacterium]|nr:riboflavin synthase [Planctomycetales bacterium]